MIKIPFQEFPETYRGHLESIISTTMVNIMTETRHKQGQQF